MINLHTKFEVSMLSHYEDVKGNTKCRILGGLALNVTQDNWQYHHTIERITTFYSTSVETMLDHISIWRLRWR